jgi:hypothetical protein
VLIAACAPPAGHLSAVVFSIHHMARHFEHCRHEVCMTPRMTVWAVAGICFMSAPFPLRAGRATARTRAASPSTSHE